jgi:hypothetical protein
MHLQSDAALDWLIDLAERMSEEQRSVLLEVLRDAEIGAGEATDTRILRRMDTYRRAMALIAGA